MRKEVKKYCLILLIFAMAILMAACGGDETGGYDGGAGDGTYETSIADFEIPEYEGLPYAYVNQNIPFFTEEELAITDIFESYSELDWLGRAGAAYANLGTELMPTKPRESISEVKPSGWNQEFYDFVEGEALFNRSHLIAFSLAGENANEKNLITGTRTMNAVAMQQFEIMTAQYIEDTGNTVLYRVTPVYEGNNLVASGVLMEGYSQEDKGYGICFNVYCFNVEPGVGIDYYDGDSWEDPETLVDEYNAVYVVNTGNGKFHYTDCDNAEKMSDSNRLYLNTSADRIEKNGYIPAGCCNP